MTCVNTFLITINADFLNIHLFLDWSPKLISGIFNHGNLDGVVNIQTWRGQPGYLTLRNGVIHGPAYFHGQVPILDMEVRY